MHMSTSGTVNCVCSLFIFHPSLPRPGASICAALCLLQEHGLRALVYTGDHHAMPSRRPPPPCPNFELCAVRRFVPTQEHGLRALIYSGDHDLCVPHTGSERWVRGLTQAQGTASSCVLKPRFFFFPKLPAEFVCSSSLILELAALQRVGTCNQFGSPAPLHLTCL